MRIHILRRASVIAALLPLTMAAGCMSANKRLEQGMKLEERGRPADAARRYVDALRRDPNLADARARLQESGRLAVEQYLRESDAAASAGAHDDAAESLLRLDDLRRDVAAVGVELAVPADYAHHRRAVLDAAIESSIDQGAQLAESGRYSDALGRLERAARWQPSGEQRRQVDEARLDTYSGWTAAEAAAGRHRGAYQVAERAISSLGRQFPGIERLVEAQEYALDEGTLRVAVLPIAASPSAGRALTASFLRDVENELEAGAWARPPAFVEIVEPRDVRREARRFNLDDLGYTSEAARLGRAVGADLVVMLEVDSVAITEPDANRERRTARTRSGADTAYVVRSGRREGWTRVRYVVVSVDDRRVVSRDYVAPQASRSFREGEYAGDWRQLMLQDDDRRLFDPSRRDDARANLMLELSRQLAEQLSREIYDRVLSQVR
jgi:tetratricopeptide (TPR) repeat protein